MSRRYEFGDAGGAWADVDDLDHFEDVDPGEHYLVLGDPQGSAYVLYGSQQSIATELRTLLAYVETVPPPDRVTDPQDPRLLANPVEDEFFYFDGESWITVEAHEHQMEDHGDGLWICSECPASGRVDATGCNVCNSDDTEHVPFEGCSNQG